MSQPTAPNPSTSNPPMPNPKTMPPPFPNPMHPPPGMPGGMPGGPGMPPHPPPGMPPMPPMPMPPHPMMIGGMPGGMPPGMPGMPPGMPGMPPGMPGMPPGMPGPPPMPGMPFPPMPGMFPPNMMFTGMKPKGKGPQPLDKWANVPPNNTIYVNNLNEKISRDETVNGLREVFSQFGKVLSIVCYTKIKRCKGQAWVVMEKTESATKAIREMQNFIFFQKPMRVAYSKNVSDATLKRDNKPLPKRERPPKKKKLKKKIVVEEAPKKKKKRKKSKDKKKEDSDDSDDDIEMKRNDKNENDNNNTNNSNKNKKQIRRNNMIAPNKTLFLQNIPSDATNDEMNRLFMTFPGFRGVSLIENKPGIGFAEFDNTHFSSNAQRSLNGYTIRGKDIIVEFAQ